MRTPTLEPSAPRRAVVYPDSDGKPMAETREHREAMTYAIAAAQACLSSREDLWISGNDFVYFNQILVYHPTGTEVHVAYFGVTHLPGGQTNIEPART